MSRIRHILAHACLVVLTGLGAPARAGTPPPAYDIALTGPVETVFSAKRDACDGADVADAPARAFRDASGQVVLFGLHDTNRALRGPDFAHLKLDCAVVLASRSNPDPAAFDDRSWITALATRDGRHVTALVHDEYQANAHPGRCAFEDYMKCWYNAVVAVTSDDGGRTFSRPRTPAVVAAAPFRQEVDQGRHRGFFNPSNIVGDGPWSYLLVGTTGWTGQPGGVCLLRAADPADAASWRAYDGRGFSTRFGDPYAPGFRPGGGCAPIAPFPAPVGSVARLRGTGLFVAVFQASADGGRFPQPGFYTATSRDLVTWSAPRLVLVGRTLYDDPCASGGQLIAYPSLIDPAATGRTFDDVGDGADLYYATLKVEGCRITGMRDMVRRRATFVLAP